jgi:hypothetical protein
MAPKPMIEISLTINPLEVLKPFGYRKISTMPLPIKAVNRRHDTPETSIQPALEQVI